MRFTRLLVLLAFLLLQISLVAQPAMLPYRPVTADFSNALNRMIMVSGNPNALHIYDPVSKTDVAVSLVQPPLSLALSPDGKHAAVGHDALVSYVNLVNASVEKTFTIPTVAGSVVLTSAWIYVIPTYSGQSVSVELATATVKSSSFVYGSGGKLNSAANAVYGTRDGISPNDIERYDISAGPLGVQTDSIYHGDYCIFGPVWFSPDGSLIYTGCGTVFHASKDPKLDMYYAGSLQSLTPSGSSGSAGILALAESAKIGRVAVIPKPGTSYNSDQTVDGVVMLFDSAYRRSIGQLALSPITAGGATFRAHGKALFFNEAATELFVLAEADKESGLLNGFAVQRISLAAPASCGATFAAAGVTIPATGATGSVKVNSSAECLYSAGTSDPWIQIVSGGYGSGTGSLSYMVRPNLTGSDRRGAITMGGRTFTIDQDGASLPAGSPTPLGYTAVDAAYAKAADKIVLVAANPDELHIYDPVSKADTIIPLVAAPLSVSVRPDGRFAAVGHDGWVSYVNLGTATVERVFQVVTDVGHVLLAGNGYMYLFPRRDWSDIYSLEISSGTVTATSAIYDGRVPRLHAGGRYVYLGGNWFSKWDISAGVAKMVPNYYSSVGCGNLWLAEDGARLFCSSAKAYLTSEIPAQDMQYNGSLSMATSLAWADHSLARKMTAVIPFSNSGGAVEAGDTQVQIYGDAYLGYAGSIPLPQISVGSSSFAAHGQFAFWNSAGNLIYAVMQADAASGLLGRTAIAELSPDTLFQPTVAAVVSAASQAPGRIAPGELVSIYGSGLGPSTPTVFTIDPVKGARTTLAGVQVLFGTYAAPILFASATQINAIVPYEVSTSGNINMKVSYQGILSPAVTLVSATAAPAVFTMDASGSGQAVAINQDGTVCDSVHPAAPGSYVSVYFTGGGRTNPSGVTGSISGTTLKYLAQTALATVGNQPVRVTFAGAAPFMVDGVGQLNIQLPADAQPGDSQPLILTVGTNSSPATATIAVR